MQSPISSCILRTRMKTRLVKILLHLQRIDSVYYQSYNVSYRYYPDIQCSTLLDHYEVDYL